MLRQIVLLAVSIGVCSVGFIAARDIKKRGKTLHEFVYGLEAMRREMQFNLAPLPDLLLFGAEQTSGAVSEFFSSCAACISSPIGYSFAEIWRNALAREELELAEEELTVLKHLGGILGRYDGDEQIKAIDDSIERLKSLSCGAEEISKRNGKIYTALGLVSGAFVFLLLI